MKKLSSSSEVAFTSNHLAVDNFFSDYDLVELQRDCFKIFYKYPTATRKDRLYLSFQS